MDPAALRRRFSTMLSNNNNEITGGFRRNAFLYLDGEAFRSRETARPYVWLAEPGPHNAPTLFARLVQRDLQGEARRKPYRHTSELSRLHATRRWM
ncbi:hypothetical protein BDW75DRAFT_231024 [Aspergillus navahoensis]